MEISTKIKVVGVGGAGGAAVARIAKTNPAGLEYLAINTDAQALNFLKGPVKKIRIGQTLTKGLGTGMNPELGRAAIEESKEEVKEALREASLVFITAGMGGGTGSGASPLVADLAKEVGALTIAIVTKPFAFEGTPRKSIAETGIKELVSRVDTLITIPNSRILSLMDKGATLLEGFNLTDKILADATQGISEILTVPGLVNVDFADVRAVIQGAGSALLTIGTSQGTSRAREAVKAALENPLLDFSIKGARGALFIVTGPLDLRLAEVDEIAQIITRHIDKNAKVIFGSVIDEKLKDKLKVTLIATGFDGRKSGEAFPLPAIDLEPKAPIKREVRKDEVPKDKSPQKKFKSKAKALEEVKVGPKTGEPQLSEDELEIPAFLRKKLM